MLQVACDLRQAPAKFENPADYFHGTLRKIFRKFYVFHCNDFVQKEAHVNANIS